MRNPDLSHHRTYRSVHGGSINLGINENGWISLFNSTAEKVFSISENESIGKSVAQLPLNGVVAEFRVSRIELEYFLKEKNALCDYLLNCSLELMKNAPVPNWSRPLWDVAVVAWLLNPEFMEDRLEHSPIFEYDLHYGIDRNRHFIKYVYHINRDVLFDDMFHKLITNI